MRIPAFARPFPASSPLVAAAFAVLTATALLSAPSAHAQAPVRVPSQAPLPTPSSANTNATAEEPERKVSGLRVNPDTTPPPPEVAESINSFFNELKNGAADKAYDILLANTRIRERRDQVQALVGRTAQALALYGKVHGAEMYDNRKLGSRLIVLTYLSYSDIQPLRWRFVYYKAATSWIMINLDCDDKLSAWYE